MQNVELKFADTHEWVRLEGEVAVIGISDHAQDVLGDLVYVELPKVGAVLTQGAELGVVESVKAASDVYAPVSGAVTEVNTALESTPELVNTSPYEQGWLCKIALSNAAELEALYTEAQYQEQVQAA